MADDQVRRALLHHSFALEHATSAWNVAGMAVLAAAAISARSVALSWLWLIAVTLAGVYFLHSAKVDLGARSSHRGAR